MQERRDEEHRDDADRDVDPETPAPLVVVRDPSAERRSQRRRDDDAEEEDGLHETLLCAREDLSERRLCGREERCTAGTLQQTPQHDLTEARRRSAQERRDEEEDDRKREVILTAEAFGKERGHRQNDDVREDI